MFCAALVSRKRVCGAAQLHCAALSIFLCGLFYFGSYVPVLLISSGKPALKDGELHIYIKIGRWLFFCILLTWYGVIQMAYMTPYGSVKILVVGGWGKLYSVTFKVWRVFQSYHKVGNLFRPQVNILYMYCLDCLDMYCFTWMHMKIPYFNMLCQIYMPQVTK